MIFLILSPPGQFAQGFYNSKNMVMLATGIFLLYSLTFAVSLRRSLHFVHVMLSGYALAIRPQAFVFVVASIAAMALATRHTFAKKL